jgi:hypothetical protein
MILMMATIFILSMGGGGGYAMAAKGLKAQIEQSKSNPHQ